MTNGRVLAIGLDGFELSYASSSSVKAGSRSSRRGSEQDARSAPRARRGDPHRPGMGALLVGSLTRGRGPARGGRVRRRPATPHGPRARASSRSSRARHRRRVVFDAPYADLSLTPDDARRRRVGPHDPGLSGSASNPPELLGELVARVGAYPSTEWMYLSPWPSVDATRTMGDGARRRDRGPGPRRRWLFSERLPDWELGIVVVSELHSAAEAFWHGVDPDHPLHDHASAPAAADALRDVYEAIDRFVGELVDATDADTVVLFSMGGMGANHSDVPSMVLLPELVSRWATGRRLLDVPPRGRPRPTVVPPGRATPRSSTAPGIPRSRAPPASPPVAACAAARYLPAPIHRRVSRGALGTPRPLTSRPATRASSGSRRLVPAVVARDARASRCRRSTTAASG